MCALLLILLNAVLLIHSVLADSLAVISDISESQIVNVGDDVEFNCTAKNVGNYTVSWSKFTGDSNSNPVVLSIQNTLSLGDHRYSITETKDKTQDLRTYTFKIRQVESSDNGIYECAVIVSTAEKFTKNVRLSVKHPPIISEERTPQSIKVVEGERLEIVCHADGYPQPTISWRREDNTIMPTGNMHAGNIMQITQAHRLDRGGYYCIADNGVGKAAKKLIRVEVDFRPQISIPRPKIAQVQSHPIELECIVQSSPSPAVSWYRNGAQLKSGSSYEIRNMAYAHETTKSVLHIFSVKESDFGDYFCNATNKLGHADARLHLFKSVIPIPSTD